MTFLNIKTEFTELECRKFRELCNFTDDERAVFDLRVKGKSVLEIMFSLRDTTYAMSEATINRRLKNIKRKIAKVL